ncbi:hypothetical protein EA462_10210 [Natrarchaeobius halalkaliphilus]|uniref:Uncharacterized protein n=1 Tax=Natrarchaeobius halalkaliphilus TaxID=1679091 RepID=A0A3N6LMP1_9EURY|nr:hypothetical protein [Natrarchaeobius halalkaliphilus]RQG90338.1 hypothetical protein EA462_10210 [Natrarchaeobius halalkaliphilus]
MDAREYWNLIVSVVAIGIGISVVDTSIVAAICLVTYGSLAGLQLFNEEFEAFVSNHSAAVSAFQTLLLIGALAALYL